jgi:hypothetical protein
MGDRLGTQRAVGIFFYFLEKTLCFEILLLKPERCMSHPLVTYLKIGIPWVPVISYWRFSEKFSIFHGLLLRLQKKNLNENLRKSISGIFEKKNS